MWGLALHYRVAPTYPPIPLPLLRHYSIGTNESALQKRAILYKGFYPKALYKRLLKNLHLSRELQDYCFYFVLGKAILLRLYKRFLI